MTRFLLKIFAITSFVLVIKNNTRAQGVSMSFIIPKDGYFSVPVSPLSVRGLGYKWGVIGFAAGGSLYNMPGLPLSDLSFESDKPLVGPFWSLLVPLQLTLGVDGDAVSFQVLAGAFGMWNIAPRINYGNMDRAIAEYEGWQVANADMDFKNKLGGGWIAGAEIQFHVSRDFSLSAEVEYLSGGAAMPIKGSYTGGNSGVDLETKEVDFQKSSVLLEGFEISLGVVFHGR